MAGNDSTTKQQATSAPACMVVEDSGVEMAICVFPKDQVPLLGSQAATEQESRPHDNISKCNPEKSTSPRATPFDEVPADVETLMDLAGQKELLDFDTLTKTISDDVKAELTSITQLRYFRDFALPYRTRIVYGSLPDKLRDLISLCDEDEVPLVHAIVPSMDSGTRATAFRYTSIDEYISVVLQSSSRWRLQRNGSSLNAGTGEVNCLDFKDSEFWRSLFYQEDIDGGSDNDAGDRGSVLNGELSSSSEEQQIECNSS
ncbi:hypothetical protein HK102_004171, partial [Quaeritorhiza haematococci]